MHRVIIADTHDTTIHGIRTIVQQQKNYAIAGIVHSAEALCHQMERKPVDLVIMGECLPDASVVSTMQLITNIQLSCIILFSGFANGYVIAYYLRHGLNAFLCRYDSIVENLPCAMDTVMRGRLYLSPSARSEYQSNGEIQGYMTDVHVTMLNYLTMGMKPGQIATAMGLSVSRVYWLRRNLRQMFNANSNEQMINNAMQAGFLYPFT